MEVVEVAPLTGEAWWSCTGCMHWLVIVVIGAGVGFLGGLFGKGGSAIATPLLHAAGVPAIVAVAAPLPATIPSTIVAGVAYARERLVDRSALTWGIGVGVPATIVGALATRWISGGALVVATDVVVILLGARFLIAPGGSSAERSEGPARTISLAGVSAVVGVSAGLLANSGGFLLAPLYLVILRMSVKRSFATSLAVASVLAVPGTLVHWALGHIDWSIVFVFGAASVPLSFLGARVAIRTAPEGLERTYGAVLLLLGSLLLLRGG